jgi:hypothetical protein
MARNDLLGKELFPRTHGAEPHEYGHVEEEVHDGLKGIMFRLLAEPVAGIVRQPKMNIADSKEYILPCEGVSRNEASQYVVRVDESNSTYDQELQKISG